MNHFVCIHGHFYQPPRENPWLEEVELQDSAQPFHDWNKRINFECYAPNAFSRILDPNEKIINIVNNYVKISFDFGPTLLSWMERHEPETYQAILQADKESQKIFNGHGAAFAHCYNHMIMPLANFRDKQTQIIWGLKDFESRFKRKSEGMWLPETAVDYTTLELLVDQGIKFTVLSPRQAKATRRIKDKAWKDAAGGKIDPTRPYLCRLPSGQTIAIFFYDGLVAHEVAFGGLLSNGENFSKRLLSCFTERKDPQLVHVATDGESYGHHHAFGNMALSYGLYHIDKIKSADLTVYGKFLEEHPPVYEVDIFENSSWSCVHGIERWRNNCGCNSGGHPSWTQQWRDPLRESLDWLRDKLVILYEDKMPEYMKNPWGTRDAFIDVVLDRSKENVEKFFAAHTAKELTKEDKVQALKLLEMQRHCMLMYSSCGWFFDEISGIETTQILQYAKRAIDLARETTGISLEEEFLNRLGHAVSNIPEFEDGATVYQKIVQPRAVDLLKMGAQYALFSLLEDKMPEDSKVYIYSVNKQFCELMQEGDLKLVVGRGTIFSNITWEEKEFQFAALNSIEHNLIGGVQEFTDDKIFTKMLREFKEALFKKDTTAIVGLMESNFGPGKFTLFNLFKDEQIRILYKVLESTLQEIEVTMRQIRDLHDPVIQVMKRLKIPLPKIVANTIVPLIDKEFLQIIGNDGIDFKRLEVLVSEVKEWSLEIDRVTLGYLVQREISRLMQAWLKKPEEVSCLETMHNLLKVLEPLGLQVNLWKVQNIFFENAPKIYKDINEKAASGDPRSLAWVKAFHDLEDTLHLNLKEAG